MFLATPVPCCRRSGFTLVELLVVTGVVAVMAAVLFPVLTSTKEAAKGAQDLNNLKNLSQGSLIYAMDADDRCLPVGAPAQNYRWSPQFNDRVDAQGLPWKGWGLRLAPYVRSYEAFRSPFSPRQAAFSGDCAHASGMDLSNNYSYNWMLGGDGTFGHSNNPKDPYAWSPDGSRSFDRPILADSIAAPEGTVAYMLGARPPMDAEKRGCLYSTIEASDFTNQLRQYAFRNDGANIAFADGHGRFVSDERIGEAARSAGRPWTIFHLKSRRIWMEPTMPFSNVGYENRDPRGTPAGEL